MSFNYYTGSPTVQSVSTVGGWSSTCNSANYNSWCRLAFVNPYKSECSSQTYLNTTVSIGGPLISPHQVQASNTLQIPNDKYFKYENVMHQCMVQELTSRHTFWVCSNLVTYQQLGGINCPQGSLLNVQFWLPRAWFPQFQATNPHPTDFIFEEESIPMLGGTKTFDSLLLPPVNLSPNYLICPPMKYMIVDDNTTCNPTSYQNHSVPDGTFSFNMQPSQSIWQFTISLDKPYRSSNNVKFMASNGFEASCSAAFQYQVVPLCNAQVHLTWTTPTGVTSSYNPTNGLLEIFENRHFTFSTNPADVGVLGGFEVAPLNLQHTYANACNMTCGTDSLPTPYDPFKTSNCAIVKNYFTCFPPTFNQAGAPFNFGTKVLLGIKGYVIKPSMYCLLGPKNRSLKVQYDSLEVTETLCTGSDSIGVVTPLPVQEFLIKPEIEKSTWTSGLYPCSNFGVCRNVEKTEFDMDLKFTQQCHDRVVSFVSCQAGPNTPSHICCGLHEATSQCIASQEIFRRFQSQINHLGLPESGFMFARQDLTFSHPLNKQNVTQKAWFNFEGNFQRIQQMKFFSTKEVTASDPSALYSVKLKFNTLSGQQIEVEQPYRLKCQQDLYNITYDQTVTNSQSYFYNGTQPSFSYQILGFGTNSSCSVQWYNVTLVSPSLATVVYPAPECASLEFCDKMKINNVLNGTMSFHVQVSGGGGLSIQSKQVDLSFVVCVFELGEAFSNSVFFPWNNETKATYKIQGINLRKDSDCVAQTFEIIAVNPPSIQEFSQGPTCQNPCNTYLVNTSMRFDLYSFTFKVRAQANMPSIFDSPLITMTIGRNTSNHYAPIVPGFPLDVTVVSTQTRVYTIPRLFDEDGDQNLQITNFVSSSSLFYMHQSPLEIRLRQTDPPTETGTYQVSFMVHDSRNLNTTYSMKITIEPPLELIKMQPVTQEGTTTESQMQQSQNQSIQESVALSEKATEETNKAGSVQEMTSSTQTQDSNDTNTLINSTQPTSILPSGPNETTADPQYLDEPIDTEAAEQQLSQMKNMTMDQLNSIPPSMITEMASQLFAEELKAGASSTSQFTVNQQKTLYKRLGTVFHVSNIDSKNQVVLSFSNDLDKGLSPQKIQSVFKFEVRQNQEYSKMLQEQGKDQLRNTNIRSSTLEEIGEKTLTFSLSFESPDQVSEGGIGLMDKLAVSAADIKALKFQQVETMVGREKLVIKPFLVPQKPQEVEIPPQLDLKSKLTNIAVQSQEMLEQSMKGILLGNFVLNTLVSVSMKQLIKAIRVFQIISMFVLIPINYPPLTLIFMVMIYNFATFKVVPKEVMLHIARALGIIEEKVPELPVIKIPRPGRKLSETQPLNHFSEQGFTDEPGSSFVQLNMLVLGLLGLPLLILFLFILRLLMMKYQKVRELFDKVQYMLFFNVIHSTLNTAAIPIQVTVMFNIKIALRSNSEISSFVVPVLTILTFFLYPVIVYRHLIKNKECLVTYDTKSSTYKRHNAAYGMLIMKEENYRAHLRIWMLVHYRRLVYALVIVWLDQVVIIQLGAIMMISTGIMIIVLNYRPFITRSENWSESINEVIILVVLYHMLSLTDIVPFQPKRTNYLIGLSNIAVISLSAFAFIIQIARATIEPCVKKCQRAYHKKQFEKRKARLIEKNKEHLDQLKKSLKENEDKIKQFEKLVNTRQLTEEERKEVEQICHQIMVLKFRVAESQEKSKVLEADEFLAKSAKLFKKRDLLRSQGYCKDLIDAYEPFNKVKTSTDILNEMDKNGELLDFSKLNWKPKEDLNLDAPNILDIEESESESESSSNQESKEEENKDDINSKSFPEILIIEPEEDDMTLQFSKVIQQQASIIPEASCQDKVAELKSDIQGLVSFRKSDETCEESKQRDVQVSQVQKELEKEETKEINASKNKEKPTQIAQKIQSKIESNDPKQKPESSTKAKHPLTSATQPSTLSTMKNSARVNYPKLKPSKPPAPVATKPALNIKKSGNPSTSKPTKPSASAVTVSVPKTKNPTSPIRRSPAFDSRQALARVNQQPPAEVPKSKPIITSKWRKPVTTTKGKLQKGVPPAASFQMKQQVWKEQKQKDKKFIPPITEQMQVAQEMLEFVKIGQLPDAGRSKR